MHRQTLARSRHRRRPCGQIPATSPQTLHLQRLLSSLRGNAHTAPRQLVKTLEGLAFWLDIDWINLLFHGPRSSLKELLRRRIACLEEAIAIRHSHPSLTRKDGLRSSLLSLEFAYSSAGYHAKAEKVWRELVCLGTRKGNRRTRDLADALCGLGKCQYVRGRNDDAVNSLEHAFLVLKLLKVDDGDWLAMNILEALADALTHQEQYPRAISLYSRAMRGAMEFRHYGAMLNRLFDLREKQANAHLKNGDRRAAVRAYCGIVPCIRKVFKTRPEFFSPRDQLDPFLRGINLVACDVRRARFQFKRVRRKVIGK